MASKDIKKAKKKKKIGGVKAQQNPEAEQSAEQDVEKIAAAPLAVLGKGLKIKGNIDSAKNAATGSSQGAKKLSAIRDGNISAPERNKKSKHSTTIQQKAPRRTAKVPKPPAPPKVASLVRGIHGDMLEIEKEASGSPSWGKTLGQGLMMGGGIAAASAGVSGAIYGANKLHKNIKTENMWKELKRRRPDLTGGQKDRENFEVLKQFSPDIASNITTLESYMERMKHQMMTPHEFVGDLTKIQKDRSSIGRSGDFADSAGKSMGSGIEMALKNRHDLRKDNK